MNLKELRRLRKQKKITQNEMGQALGIAQSVYQRIETGEIELKAKHIPVIAFKLGMTPSKLSEVLFDGLKTA
jgi:transcriptional regulator with XRE-family HTH domain